MPLKKSIADSCVILFGVLFISVPINAIMRAWGCSGRTQFELVKKLQDAEIITHDAVARDMERVDRRFFCPRDPYNDAPQTIGFGQTISAPHMHAYALEEIYSALKESQSPTLCMLDVGIGSGYLAACLGQWVHPPKPIIGKNGTVYGIDVWPELLNQCQKNLNTLNGELLQYGTIQIGIGDGWEGLEGKRFDAIHVGAAAHSFPNKLMMQLKVGGIMIVPVGPEGEVQTLYRIQKVQNSPQFSPQNFEIQKLLGVRYVPLIHPE
jgi:protein-L-isoaspartate(D-aspartate) O-methyltransferase